ncbi:uncharacterized protein LOC119613668 [Lucilia sericata]|uniref:uncharacterized protein LOC119613668 n=1 Tax=Lucilia sericata TaxID=13632 RepID=UPI0018A7F5EE|nr:uncharacterized protein LOC119613668 [Lucilia sericata]
MDHLDLAGVLTTPPQWNLPAFEQQDAVYLSSSRQMLEPIMEETSEDEEYALNSWQQYEQQGSDNEGGATTEGESVCGATSGAGGASFWSSAESDTGSVIRIEVTKDNDSNSERDFLCPAKRPRRCEESLAQSLPEEEVILRRPLYGVEKNNSLERFLNYENFSRDSWGTNSQQRSSVGSRRGFDDFYSDSDSLSYNSLSRSSSLIQFESLERQLLMQEQHVSMNSLGNSSPSLMSFDNNEETGNKLLNNSGNNSANNSRRGSQSSLMKKYESLDGRLHQTYYDLDKLNFDDMDHSSGDNFARNGNLKVASHLAELRSDSESSSEGSEGTQSVLSPADINDNEFLFKKFTRTNSQQNKKGKSSAENLSEDSGYCEPAMGFGLRRSKSQSLLKNYEKFSEEEEEMENKSLIHMEQQQTTATTTEFKNTNTRHHHQQQQETPPHSPQLEYIRHKQRTEAHSPSPVSSEVSTSSSSSSSSSACSQHSSSSSTSSSSTASTSSSATTCASKASFTWLMPTANATTAGAVRQLPRVQADQQLHSPTHFSLNDLCVVKTSNEENAATQIEKEFSSLTRSTTSNDHCGERQCKENISSKEYSNSEKSKSIEEVEYNSELKINYWKNGEKFLEEEEEQKLIVQTLNKERVRKECSAKAKSGEFNNYVFNINNFPKSLTTSCPNTPEFWRAKDRDYTPLSLSKVYDNLMPSWPVKTSSVPSELCNLGRKKKLKRAQQTKTSLEVDCPNSEPLTDNDSLAESLTSLEDLQTLKRSLSWCSCTQNSGDCISFRAEAKNLALLHRSYHNLASLDIDLEEQETMAERRISSDYETEIICKNNFLLDELSAHYERTASILNDKPLEDNDINKPLKPDRSQARKSSNSSYSQGEESESEQVQHVQLVIRKPPARQKRANGQQLAQEKANSLTQDFSFQAIMQSGPTKTFDQDPTILKTSYAQSLEKCNFDCKELSNQDLNKTRSIPKRRFHSQANYAKKKNLVSSTPNLNAYDFQHQDDIEDDMFVSSAHNSMHQLPLSQTQKPLGILLPAGSRTSFGKEVSFCPVVSKYCWQEQSSEECNEGLESEGQGEEESEDELLDNADATVIYNTKENENIAAKYNEEFLKKEQPKTEQEIEIIKEKAVMKEINKQKVEKIIKESTIKREEEQERENEKLRDGETKRNETPEKIKQREETLELENTQTNETQEQMENLKQMELLPQLNVSLTTNVNNETLKTQTPDAQNINETKSVNNKVNNNTCLKTKPTVVVARPLSIQLPILTEPPINRAHHILYASQQMLDNFQRQQQNEENEHFNKSQSTQNLSNKMSSKTKELKQSAAPPPANQAVNNNNDIMKSKFKHEEKHPNSKGFLTRFANGFRFSLRRNKKKLPKDQQQVEQLETNAVAKENKTKSLPAAHKQADFIHIPLKGPLPENRINQNKQTNGNAVNAKQKTAKTNNNDKVTGKPPIPPQQQQQLLKMQSAQSSPQPSQQPLVEVGLSRFYTETENNPTLPFNPQQTTQDFLNGEKQALYHEHAKQSCANLKQETPENVTEMMSVNSNNTTYEFNNSSSPSRASVSQKTQMFNNLSRQSVPQQQQNQQQPKIGLIETNLDTHETIITGKTRSLINIGPNQQPQQSRFAGNKRLHTNAHHNHTYNHHQYQHHHRHHHHDGNEADDDDYDDNDDDEVVVRPDGTVVVIKNAGSNGSTASQTAQIVSVRRPHKSMEFLLDKENQKDVMVSRKNCLYILKEFRDFEDLGNKF